MQHILSKNISRSKTSNLLIYLLIVYSITAIYFFIQSEDFSSAQFFVPLLTLVLLFQILIGRIKLIQIDLLIIVALLLSTLIFNFSSPRIIDAFHVIILLISCRKISPLNRKFVIFIYYATLVSIIYQLFNYQDKFGNPSLFLEQTNFVAFYFFLFFLFCFKNNLKLGILISILYAFVSYSRSYMLSLFVFGLVFIAEKLFPKLIERKGLIFFNRRSFVKILIVANLFILGLGTYYINHLGVQKNAERNMTRVTVLNDESNLERFKANAALITLFTRDLDTALFGLSEQDEDYLKSLLDTNVVHNSFLRVLVYRGIIFSFFYFIALGIIIRRLYSFKNIKYLLSLLAFSLFLHAGYQGYPLILFITTIALPDVEKK